MQKHPEIDEKSVENTEYNIALILQEGGERMPSPKDWASVTFGCPAWAVVERIASDYIERDEFLLNLSAEKALALFQSEQLSVPELTIADRAIWWCEHASSEVSQAEMRAVLSSVRWSLIAPTKISSLGQKWRRSRLREIFPEFDVYLHAMKVDPLRPLFVPKMDHVVRKNSPGIWHMHPGFNSLIKEEKSKTTGTGIYSPIPNKRVFKFFLQQHCYTRFCVFTEASAHMFSGIWETEQHGRRLDGPCQVTVALCPRAEKRFEMGLFSENRRYIELRYPFTGEDVYVAVFTGEVTGDMSESRKTIF